MSVFFTATSFVIVDSVVRSILVRNHVTLIAPFKDFIPDENGISGSDACLF
jgi:hypothetical protein